MQTLNGEASGLVPEVLHKYDGHIPATLGVTDTVTLVWGVSCVRRKMRRRVVISENDTVQMWALKTVYRFREQAEAVHPHAFA
jgi:hypothetical protein